MTTALEGTFNFRDTGGMPLAAGGTSRCGILYRSDALSGLSPAGLEHLAASARGGSAAYLQSGGLTDAELRALRDLLAG